MAATITVPAQIRTPVRVATATVRTLLGLVFAVFGLNGFLLFMPGDASGLPEARSSSASRCSRPAT